MDAKFRDVKIFLFSCEGNWRKLKARAIIFSLLLISLVVVMKNNKLKNEKLKITMKKK